MNLNGERSGQEALDRTGTGGNGRQGARQSLEQETPAGDRANGSPKALEKTGVVYFIETKDREFVKIGYSTQAYRRLWQLGTLRPGNYALRLIGWLPGTLETERWLHEKFAADRDRGEWFRSSPPLRQFIETMGLIQPAPEPERTRQAKPPRKPKHVETISPPSKSTGDAISAYREVLYMRMAKKKDPAAVALGRRGGRARVPKGFAVLTKAERIAKAKEGAEARWANKKKGGK